MLLLVCIYSVDDWSVALFHTKLVDTVDVSLNGSGYDIGICAEAIIYMTIVFHLHVNLTHIV